MRHKEKVGIKMKSRSQLINIIGTTFFTLILIYAILSYSKKRYLLAFNSKTTIGMIYDKGVTSTKRRCKNFYIFTVNNKFYSSYHVHGDDSCNEYSIRQKGIVTYDVDNPTVNEIDFSINPESAYLDSVYKNHIFFKSKEQVNRLFYEE